jgi:hypothetical protein
MAGPPLRTRRPMATVLVVLGALALIVGCRPVPELTASPSGSAAAAVGSLTISEVDQPGLFDGPERTVLRAMAAAGSGFVVLGDVGTADHLVTQAWLSEDGMSWQRTPTIDALEGAVINAITEMRSGRLLAVGWNRDADEVWSSDDHGRTWQARPVAKDPWPRAGSVAAGATGALLLDAVPIEHGPDQRSRLWFSADGATWEAVAMPEDVFGDVRIYNVTATSKGFVALGSRAPASPPLAGDPFDGQRAAAWWSPDGRQWSVATVSDKPPMLSAVAGARGLLAFGHGEPITRHQAWLSTDGAVWAPIPGSDDLEGTFVAHGGQIAWFESIVVSSGVSNITLKTSEDGAVWTPTLRVNPLYRTGSGIGPIVAGARGWLQEGSSSPGRATLWLITVEVG